MYCNELKPEYVKCSEKIWKEARPRLLIPKELPTVADLVIIEYNRLLNDKEQLNTKWCNNWAKGNMLLTSEDKDIFDCVQIVARNFITYLSSEIFNKAEFSLVWANGESESSKERRLLDGHNHSRKPDFQILVNIEEADRKLIFGEIKPPHCTIAINQRIIKLAEFMKRSLDYLINVYGYVAGLETYGILIY
ncbi:16910_t:CDS:2, partial [Rhizophagus irregularis]